MYFIYLLFLSCHPSQRFHIVNTFQFDLCVYTCIMVIDKVLLRKEVRKKVQIREYKYKKILRQCSIVECDIFWCV
jgi:hypothetical protein